MFEWEYLESTIVSCRQASDMSQRAVWLYLPTCYKITYFNLYDGMNQLYISQTDKGWLL